ncbi:helix-turn-helix domain-containing protein [Fructilactobacillus hinvesii]|uniref:Helix-turn-helix domain-containing protein n=1 Tax=Fructilactobacillus hinvesii TaxID=2940300 RepID=A0ABY5BQC5_9LACO|nr:helix-turn-helix domain-containing protein [Fructilactobacillus hinvesii]USS87277.1 helix-turn-helix domain-containing protein [Fructilactobacillus hinvesii]
MTKISKEIKYEAMVEYFYGSKSRKYIREKYGFHRMALSMLINGFRTFGSDVLFNPPKVNAEFRIKLTEWKIRNNASYTQVAEKFGYLGLFQISQWEKIYRQNGPNGLLSLKKGRKPKMTKPKKNHQELTPEQNKIRQLEQENLELRIKNKALKLLASMKQPIDKKHKYYANSRPNLD